MKRLSTAAPLPARVIGSGEWRTWPRRLDVPTRWAASSRDVNGRIRSGELRVYTCPDRVRRVDPETCSALFGEPLVISPRAAPSDKPPAPAPAPAPVAAGPDPTGTIVRAVIEQNHRMHETSVGLVKVISEPLNTLLAAYQKTIDSLLSRVASLEAQSDAATALRSELADATQEREISLERHRASEKRRNETLQLLKDQLPAIVGTWISGDSLTGFAQRAPKDVVQAIIESAAIAEHDATILRRAAGLDKPPATVNGVNHGNS